MLLLIMPALSHLSLIPEVMNTAFYALALFTFLLFIFNYVYTCVCVWICACEYRNDVSSSGVGVTDICETPDIGSGT